MHLTRLRLDQFRSDRSWRTLDLPLERGLNLVSGPNAAGKTNLIEAGWMLAALRSLRATREGELIAWDAPAPQLMRLVGDAESRQGPVAVEIVIAARSDGSTGLSGAPLTSKRIRVNGVPRQASEALGAIRAVLFSALDIELLTGESRLRRRYLDVAVSQADRAHAVALSRYQRTVRQRNALLRAASPTGVGRPPSLPSGTRSCRARPAESGPPALPPSPSSPPPQPNAIATCTAMTWPPPKRLTCAICRPPARIAPPSRARRPPGRLGCGRRSTPRAAATLPAA